ncbi:MAG: hypothetical protein JNJ85_11370 [Candidatus Kapabacteria bacterium]|nr:hypothetical protein [Candidatus Kapabacteria bacterium]
MRYTFAVIVIVFCMYNTPQLTCGEQTYTDSTANGSSTVNNVLYFDYSGVLLTSSVSINYERLISKTYSVRLMAGYGVESGGYNSIGVSLIPTYLMGSGNSFFEIGLGGGVIQDDRNQLGITTKFVPAASVGYRYQPMDSGLFFRTGLSYSLKYGYPLHISVGYTF